MKCHYINDKKAGRVLIPGCWSVAVSDDIKRCSCSSDKKTIDERLEKLEIEVRNLKKALKKGSEKLTQP